MSYVVFARKWRPQGFGEVLGQEHITTTLKNAILNDRAAHAYIFTGPRGIGKTSVARIFAKGLNCEKGPAPTPCNECASCKDISASGSMDVLEIDGASNNSVDQVRELRENIKFSPSYGRYKIYIIDEVHMLSIGAFNALLKTLEEPPKHAKFIFATTNPEKVPPTILSRCQRFDFRRISLKLIISKLKKIVENEGLKVSDEALFSIGRASDGSLRDAESMLDQLTSFCDKKISQDDVISLLGVIKEDNLSDIIRKLSGKDTKGLLKSIDELITTGKAISQFLAGIMGYVRNLMVLKVSPDLTALIDLLEGHITRLKEEAKNFRIEELLYIFYTLSATANAVKRSEISRFILEAAFIKLSLRDDMMSLPEIAEKVARLEADADKYRRPYEEPARSREAVDGPVRISGSEKMPAAEESMMNAAEEPAPLPSESGRVSTLTAEKVKAAWSRLLEVIRGKRISISSYLLEGDIVGVKGNTVTLSFAKKFNLHKEVLEQSNNRSFVEGIASDLIGEKVKFEFVTSEEAEEPPDERSDRSRFREAQEESEIEPAGEDPENPIIQSAIEIFDGKIVKNEKRNPGR